MKLISFIFLALLAVAGLQAGGSTDMTTVTITALREPQKVDAFQPYIATGYVASDGHSNTFSDDLRWYKTVIGGADTLLQTDNIAAGTVPYADSSLNPFVYFYSKLLSAPAGANYAVRVPSTTRDTGDKTYWGPLELLLAADSKAIVPGNVLPSHIRNGTSELYNGGVDIPNVDQNFADDWKRGSTSAIVWDTDHYQGTHSIRMDGIGNYDLYSPLVRWPLSGDKPFYIAFAYKFTNATFLGAAFDANYLDIDGNILATANMLDAAGGAFVPIKDGDWHFVTLYGDGSTASDDTSSLQLDIATDNSDGGSSDSLWLDAFYVGAQSGTLKASRIQFYHPTTGLPVTPKLEVISGVLTTPNLNVTGPAGFQSGISVMGLADLDSLSTGGNADFGGDISGGYADLAAVDLRENTAPSAPPTGHVYVYAKTDHSLAYKNHAGTERVLGVVGTEAANEVYAGPTSGSAAAPTFRSLVAADLPAIPVPYDISGGVLGMPGDGALLQQFVAPRQFRLVDGLVGSQGYALTSSHGGDVVFLINLNGSPAWAMTIAGGDNVATFGDNGAVGDVVVNIGDVISVYAPSPQDGTLSDVCWTLLGTKE